MFRSLQRPGRTLFAVAVLVAGSSAQAPAQTPASTAKRPMTFLDMQLMKQAGSPAPSPDRKWLLYTISFPDWKEARRQSDIFLVSLEQGLPSTKQLTYTKEKNETSPAWSRDGRFFVFLSNRDAPASSASQNQLYLMRPDGGEARRLTDARDGVSNFAFSKDGKWLVYRSGKAGEEQLYRLAVTGLEEPKPEQLTKQGAGVGTWEIAPDSRRIYFTTADTVDNDEKQRRENRCIVDIRNGETTLSMLWAVDLDPNKVTRLTRDGTITVSGFNLSPDGKWVSFRGTSANRYQRNITEQNINADLFLLEVSGGNIERLTNNQEVGESNASFSND